MHGERHAAVNIKKIRAGAQIIPRPDFVEWRYDDASARTDQGQ